MGVSDCLVILKEWGPVFGPAIGLLVFFVWKDWRREDRLQTRVENLEQEQKEVILPMVEKCVTVIAANTAVMQRLERLMDRAYRQEGDEERCMLDRLLADAEEHRREGQE